MSQSPPANSKKRFSPLLIVLFVVLLLIGLGLVAALTGLIGNNATANEGLQTWLLVRAPDGPLPANRPVTVKSRTRDPNHYLSHVELYAVEIPATGNPDSTQKVDLLIDTQFVPFDQTTFTANQTFIPATSGDYVIKVVGYNINQEQSESEYIRFTAQ